MYQVLKLAAELGVIVTAHCENAELVSRLQQKLLAEGKTGPEWHEPSRPETVEMEGTTRFATFLETTGATGYVVHLSCAPALKAAMDAKARGVKISVESVLPHFLLDKTYAEREGAEGLKHVMSPPLREKRNQAVLWNALAAGDDRYGGHGSLPVRCGAEADGQGCVHADSEWDSGDRGARESDVHVWREARRVEPGAICGCAEYAGGEAVRACIRARERWRWGAMRIW